ncbi:histone deacetylase family protein [Marinobacterium arenosum]|uniref:histone deacetylase family protein n=1 Tax=Marinobacterium arenosum TaxID=2862496 RepID=UPI0028F4192B|nr:histone deacetylase family protein [Marinobacterium arenosum]
MGSLHPESPARLQAIEDHLNATELGKRLHRLSVQPVSRALLERVHPPEFIDWLEESAPQRGYSYVDADVALNPHSIRAAYLAAGAMATATERVINGEFSNAFCAVRPPGHHAELAQAMGFCIFNNIAVAIEQALSHQGIERVAVLDFDVHHCNGTIDIFKERPEVLICSTFQHPFYPYRYFDIERPNIVNSPLPAGTTGDQFRRTVERDWLPALHGHQPQMIFVSAGFDAHRDDPLGQLLLDEADYRWVSELIVDAAARTAGKRVVATLEGGYHLKALAASVGEHLQALLAA